MVDRKPLGIAIVGAGRIGSLRARLAADYPAANFVAVADADPARARDLAQKVGAQFHSGDNLAAISRAEVNAVIVATSEDPALEVTLAIERSATSRKPVTLPLVN